MVMVMTGDDHYTVGTCKHHKNADLENIKDSVSSYFLGEHSTPCNSQSFQDLKFCTACKFSALFNSHVATMSFSVTS